MRLLFRLILLGLILAALPAASAQYFGFGKNRVQYAAHDWRVLQSEHLDVYYFERDGADGRAASAPGGRVLAAFAAEAAEEAYREIAVLFGTDIARRVPLLVYPTHADFAVTNAVDLPVYADGIGGVTELYKNRIAVPFTGDWRDFRRVIHHELVHAVINDLYYGGSVQALLRSGLRLRIPLWFNEGLAEYSALGWDTQSDLYVRDAVLNDDLADIERLGGFFAYRGGQGVWDFIAQEYGREKVTEILERVRVGRSVRGAFERATGLGLDELSERWKRTLRTVYYPEAAAREPADAVARPLATRRTTGAAYHASPAISPLGDKVAYVATRDGLFDVYVVDTVGDREPRKLIDGQDNTQFESLRLRSPGLSWSPDGRTLAVAVTSGPGDAVALLDTQTGRVREVRPDGVDAIRSVAWSPDGAQLALGVTVGALSDIAVLDLDSGAVRNLTRDLWTDAAPAWSPDGRALVFQSDRGDATALGRDTPSAALAAGGFDARALGRRASDLYRIDLGDAAPAEATRLTHDDVWDQTAPAFARTPDGETRLLYISDANGIPNLYECGGFGEWGARSADTEGLGVDATGAVGERTPETQPDAERGDAPPDDVAPNASPSSPGPHSSFPASTASPCSPRPLTDLQTGALGVSLSADGSRAALLTLDRGTPSVYLVRTPLGRDDLPDVLRPTVWGQRRTGGADDAPAVALASARTRGRNPLLRDAADGAPPEAPPRRPAPLSPEALAAMDSVLARILSRPPEGLLASADTLSLGLAPLDSTALHRGFAADFRRYAFTDAFDEPALGRDEAPQDPFALPGIRDAEGRPVARPYRLRFSPDIVAAAGGYDTVYGVQSVTQMRFSDVLGDHRLGLSTNLVLDLRNADYALSYASLGGRTDWGLDAFHLARELPDFNGNTVYRYRNYGLRARLRYPLSKFDRVDAEVGLLGVSLSDLSALSEASSGRLFAVPRVAYTHDGTVPGFLGPRSGVRWAASLSGAPGPDAVFATALVDVRRYWSVGPGYALALRGSAGVSVGPNPQRFFAAGVENWLNATFRSLPVDGPDDFVFATPVLPLRGFGYDEASGDRFALVNAEARVPLVAALLPGPLPLLPFYNIQATGFVDAGVIAEGGLDVWRDLPADPETGADGERVLDDVLLGVGGGLRTLVLGYPVRVDWGRPFDGTRFGQTRVYVSVGLDF